MHCQSLPPVEHGYLDSTSTKPGTMITASCYHGYAMEDGVRHKRLVCQDGGQWSDDLGNCTGKGNKGEFLYSPYEYLFYQGTLLSLKN